MIETVHNSLLSLIYPQDCRVCGLHVEDHSDGVACAVCWDATRSLDNLMLCDKCGAYLGERAAPIPVFCRRCDDHHYDKARAASVYENGLAAAIIDLKRSPSLSRRLQRLLSSALGSGFGNAADLIVPIPLSARRRIERGFNQAEIIAGAVAHSIGISVDAHSLTRKVHTPIHRMGMDQKARELTVKNAFEVVRPRLIAGKNILLVDDVLTSGATASACAKVLKKNGAAKVNVFTLARAVMR